VLSDYWDGEYGIGDIKKLSNIGSRPQSIGLSDIGLRKISGAYLRKIGIFCIFLKSFAMVMCIKAVRKFLDLRSS
jgi:hypothetical protein